MSVPTGLRSVAQYVDAVRAALDDLPAETVDDLVGGLEADLAESVAESVAESGDDVRQRFGPPAVYAAELRSAAGLPPRGRRATPVAAVLRRQWPAVRDGLVGLRPAWWVVRAALVAGAASVTLGGGYGGTASFLVLLVPLTALSVWLGRVRMPRLLVVGFGLVNAVGVLALLVGVNGYWVDAREGGGSGDWTPPGVSLDGYPIGNIQPYDAQGDPLTGVQLFDEQGRPLDLSPDHRVLVRDDGSVQELRPQVDATGEQRWNVYPVPGPAGTPGPAPTVAPLLQLQQQP
ncbi:hypothetical protein GTR02_16200 [Kineococcus sp. R8]|uniref:HAAS signaling domain-containing protein n=1 Tax=Kineococcus siccus TaxID=2696567 RepID=UPI001411BAF5|nr:hypothetical protein [Kineococcus siccus]NAZ83363.1 hypothetical protein [Kineococcus siccus]